MGRLAKKALIAFGHIFDFAPARAQGARRIREMLKLMATRSDGASLSEDMGKVLGDVNLASRKIYSGHMITGSKIRENPGKRVLRSEMGLIGEAGQKGRNDVTLTAGGDQWIAVSPRNKKLPPRKRTTPQRLRKRI